MRLPLVESVMQPDLYRTVRGRQYIAQWHRAGYPDPPPQWVKAHTLRAYTRHFGLHTLVETGTYHGSCAYNVDWVSALRTQRRESEAMSPTAIIYGHYVPCPTKPFSRYMRKTPYHGDTSWGLRDVFDFIYTIESHPELAVRARYRFRRTPHIHVIEGDSATFLPSILTEAAGPILFWLDGHYSGAGTARSNADTPVLSELTRVLARPCARDVVLIDDARSFTGRDGYPSLEQMCRVVAESRPSWSVQVHDDIIRIHEGGRV